MKSNKSKKTRIPVTTTTQTPRQTKRRCREWLKIERQIQLKQSNSTKFFQEVKIYLSNHPKAKIKEITKEKLFKNTKTKYYDKK